MEKNKTKHYLAIKLSKEEKDELLTVRKDKDYMEVLGEILIRNWIFMWPIDMELKLIDLPFWKVYDLNEKALNKLYQGQWAKFPYCGKIEWFLV